jgi:hypothetical protein
MFRYALTAVALLLLLTENSEGSRAEPLDFIPKATRCLYFSRMLKSFKYVPEPLIHVAAADREKGERSRVVPLIPQGNSSFVTCAVRSKHSNMLFKLCIMFK